MPLIATLAFALLVASQTAAAQTPAQPPQAPPPDCSAKEHRQFDFWLGSWTVTTQGTSSGTNSIEADLKGCVLIEHWTAVSGSRGTSLNFYDRRTKAWYQTWVDERGGVLRLKGGLEDGRMVMRSDSIPNAQGMPTIQRITWSVLPDKTVRQLWEASTDDGKTWTAAYDGIYTKK